MWRTRTSYKLEFRVVTISLEIMIDNLIRFQCDRSTIATAFPYAIPNIPFHRPTPKLPPTKISTQYNSLPQTLHQHSRHRTRLFIQFPIGGASNTRWVLIEDFLEQFEHFWLIAVGLEMGRFFVMADTASIFSTSFVPFAAPESNSFDFLM